MAAAQVVDIDSAGVGLLVTDTPIETWVYCVGVLGCCRVVVPADGLGRLPLLAVVTPLDGDYVEIVREITGYSGRRSSRSSCIRTIHRLY